jgi:hypothetical protein
VAAAHHNLDLIKGLSPATTWKKGNNQATPQKKKSINLLTPKNRHAQQKKSETATQCHMGDILWIQLIWDVGVDALLEESQMHFLPSL